MIPPISELVSSCSVMAVKWGDLLNWSPPLLNSCMVLKSTVILLTSEGLKNAFVPNVVLLSSVISENPSLFLSNG
ncbi:hypothetical protein D3C87_1679620 [compost metagenome]